MAKQRDRYRRLFEALKSYEASGAQFTIADLSVQTNYKAAALAVYFRNRLKNVYVFTTDGVNYACRGVSVLDYDAFFDYMSQKSEKVRKQDLESVLIDKALEAFLLSLELYNKPILMYRVESVLVLLVNAWELLLKSLIVRIHGEDALFFDETRTRTISIRDCVAKVLTDTADVIRKNLEAVVDLRDQATHLVIPEIQNTLSRLLQANVINFMRTAEKYNIRNPLLSKSMGLLSLVADVKDSDEQTIRLNYGTSIANRVKNFLERVQKEEKDADSPFYAIPITYRFVLSKKSGEGDIEFSLTKDGTSARIIEVPKDPDKTHPYRLTQLGTAVNAELSRVGGPKLNRTDMLSIVYSEKVQSDKVNSYHYRAENPLTHKYSPEFADLIVRKIKEHSDYLSSCRSRYKQWRRRKSNHA